MSVPWHCALGGCQPRMMRVVRADKAAAGAIAEDGTATVAKAASAAIAGQPVLFV